MHPSEPMLVGISSAVAGLFIGWLFIMAGVHKLNAGDYYARVLGGYGMARFPSGMRRMAAWLVALGELGIGIGLYIGLFLEPLVFSWLGLERHGLYAAAACCAAALLLFYAALMALALLRGRAGTDCGCSGLERAGSLHAGLIVRNLVLVGIAGLAAAGGPVSSLPLPGWLLVLGAVFCAVLLYRSMELLSLNRRLLAESGWS